MKVLAEMGLQDELETWEHVRGLRVHAAGKVLELPFPQLPAWSDYGLVKPRKDLDKLVLERAETAGAKVLQGTEVKQAIFDRGVVTGFIAQRDGQKETVSAKWVLSAEGAATKFRGSSGVTVHWTTPWGLRYASTSSHRCSTPAGSRRTSTYARDQRRSPVTAGSSR